MENQTAYQVRYNDHQRQMARVNDEAWKFERTAKRYRVRATVAKALITLANLLSPTTQEVQAA